MMKAQKSLAVLATVSLLALSVGCNDRYAEGIAEGKIQGYEEGYDDGYVDGDKDGFERAKTYFASADYNDGFNDGKTQGISIGYSQGYGVGKNDGLAQGYTQGYNVGKNDGYNQGYNVGKTDGYNQGYNNGYDDGEFDGFNAGFDAGYDDGVLDGYDIGWEDGYDAGWDDAYGLSVGKSKNLKGYANVLSAFHNDLIDYSKIAAPKVTKRGLVANGQLLLSETSITNKDTLKRASVAEQYLVVEMSKQIKGKYGLSAERSLKVAKAANHFRKYSSTRALTAEDTNAYASEIIGADFKSLEKAYENTMKGNLSDLNSIIEKAAEKNGVSPEKMGQIVTELFI